MTQTNDFVWEKLKKKIDKMKEELASLKAKKEYLLKEINDKYNLNTLDDVKKEYKTLGSKIAKLTAQKSKMLDEIEELLHGMEES